MASFNKVILMGNLTRDPQLSYLPSQTPVCEIGLAVNRRWRSQDGQQREDVCFVDCRSYGKQAETLNQYMSKGRPILIEGRLEFDQWESQDGAKRSKHRIFIERFSFVGGPPQGGGNQGGGNQSGGYAPAPPAQAQQAPPMGGPQAAPPMDPQQQDPQQQDPQQQTPPQAPPPNAYDESGGENIPF